MTTVVEINNILNSIRSKVGNDLPIYGDEQDYIAEGVPDVPLRRSIEAAKIKLDSFMHEFILYGEFIGTNDLVKIYEDVNKLLGLIEDISNTPISFAKERVIISGEILETIRNFLTIKELTFYNNSNVSPNSILNLFSLVNSRIDAFTDINLSTIISNATLLELQQIIEALISIHNGGVSSPHLAREVVRAHKVFQSISERLRKIEVTESIENLEEKAVEIKENIGLQSNDLLIDVFKKAAGTDDIKILVYNIFIFAIFILSLLSLIFFIYLTLCTDVFIKPLTIHFYGFYISFFLFLSGLLAYLIKERKRLLNHKHYCTITHLELSALPMYTWQLNDKNKQDDLIIHLGERYFKGPNQSGSNDDISTNITTSKLSEVIKLAQEVKSTLK
ncbi:TPA: hypothetical protein VAM29_002546 [Acinetobacter baumannii]|nr:hypothetical protein [Acinetobacter baumannii]